MNEPIIKVENLSKVYKLYEKPIDRLKESLSIKKNIYHKDHYALNNVSFKIEKGETVGIIGVNGSGKSTLLKILTGVLNPTEGIVSVNGKIAALLELGAGFNPEYSGIENIYLNGTMMGFSKEQMKDRLNDIILFADIGEFINQPVKTYSSGMFARLAFAVAINVDPDILIIDEALSVGDVFFQLKCFKKFEDFRKKNKTILFVSHDMGSITKYCTSAIMIERGNLVAQGDTKFIVDLYKKSIVGLSNDNLLEETKSDNMEINQMDEWKNKMILNTDKLEYGNKKAEIIDYGVFNDEHMVTNVIEKNSCCFFKLKIRFNEKINNPIFAFSIKDVKGFEITGTNTMLENLDTGEVDVNDIIIVTFSQKMTLQGGPYFISFGCTGFGKDGSLEVYHRIYDVVNIEILASKVSNGYFDLNSKIDIVRN